ncbi:uncharacterized protein FOMMEDRAFT_31325 [Fomitiporia mediterranea MF3/22]|uniref:uncharacterized protein n=1 Tax=Fomitiporia mediterranea (strain MF3/22) TaxID=694068 RepID=UPI000440941C|nr:uncharacterized protein FOMMEDRAFT_31325 [Fomitiporia mediterranea MF3/22]EJC99252.1 hypothetical protein FOMMEDRAFT_31325 [Fomitiporia mediterranea MF3/22]
MSSSGNKHRRTSESISSVDNRAQGAALSPFTVAREKFQDACADAYKALGSLYRDICVDKAMKDVLRPFSHALSALVKYHCGSISGSTKEEAYHKVMEEVNKVHYRIRIRSENHFEVDPSLDRVDKGLKEADENLDDFIYTACLIFRKGFLSSSAKAFSLLCELSEAQATKISTFDGKEVKELRSAIDKVKDIAMSDVGPALDWNHPALSRTLIQAADELKAYKEKAIKLKPENDKKESTIGPTEHGELVTSCQIANLQSVPRFSGVRITIPTTDVTLLVSHGQQTEFGYP